MRSGALIALLFALVGCGPVDPHDDPAGRADTRQIPSNYTPGVHIGGYVNVGVKKTF